MRIWVKNETAQLVIIAVATAIGAEFMINPFSGDFFRIGLGVSIFLFLLLFSPHLNLYLAGAVTGMANVAVQTGDWMVRGHTWDLAAGLQNNLAAGFYYVAFAYGISLLRPRMNTIPPLLVGIIVAGIDLMSNEIELLIRGLLVGPNPFSLNKTYYLAAVALVRSYFVIGLYSSVAISQVRSLHAEQQKRLEQMLTVGSALYGEAFYLKKSTNTIERIAVSSFELYQSLAAKGLTAYSGQALGIAQQIHEVKKDSQRILAGLLKLVDVETVGSMSIGEMVRFVMDGNREYAAMLGKRITFAGEVASGMTTPYFMPLLTVLNNLAANAVESIAEEGEVRLDAGETDQELLFRITDTGRGIDPSDAELIFEPGFTTKFSDKGAAATGIGLSHVRDIVHYFGGRIALEPPAEGGGAAFVVRLPMETVRNGGGTDGAFFRDRG